MELLFLFLLLPCMVFGQSGSSYFGLLGSLLNPFGSLLSEILSGDGLIDGALGAVEGVLGVDATFDYVVVGGGTAGNAIGTRLAQGGHSVTADSWNTLFHGIRPIPWNRKISMESAP
jgi:hypothetical protein